MTPSRLQEKIVAERVAWIREMVAGIRELPLRSYDDFVADARNVATAESYLRRSLEALMDLGRHILSKGFGEAAAEYRLISRRLLAVGVLGENEARLMGVLAGYRNRLVHFYNQINRHELFEICGGQLDDVTVVLNALLGWIRSHPEKIDRAL
jgi:uncharacterized protein YutE (UPF0331/DUF86 family)